MGQLHRSHRHYLSLPPEEKARVATHRNVLSTLNDCIRKMARVTDKGLIPLAFKHSGRPSSQLLHLFQHEQPEVHTTLALPGIKERRAKCMRVFTRFARRVLLECEEYSRGRTIEPEYVDLLIEVFDEYKQLGFVEEPSPRLKQLIIIAKLRRD